MTQAGDRKSALGAALRHAILTLEQPPGADLDEPALCAAFGVSRTPYREVMQLLAGEGFVSLTAQRGARVADLSHTTLRSFFVAAPMIYAAVLKLAARHATPAQLAHLEAAQDAFQTALAYGTVAERTLANNRFHMITGEMAANPYLLPSFRRLLIDHARIGMTFYRPRDAAEAASLGVAAEQHAAIIEAIRAGDEDTAGDLAEAHWALSRDMIERFVMPEGLDQKLGTLPACGRTEAAE